ncbi:hypothetical protein, partial [Streptococcus pseudopneumoniae]|uniref:hypothetical protein n=1 Tax=Streptococcus pseudopneumoniae TaxID=257758 RepID=UPI0019D547BB
GALSLSGCTNPPLTPADRVRYGVEALRVACGAYLQTDGRDENLRAVCDQFILPERVTPDAGN